jgi:hypothetical protein
MRASRRIERISAELATLEAQDGGPTPGMQ